MQKTATLLAVILVAMCGCMSAKEKNLKHPNSPKHSIDLNTPDIVEDLDKGKLKIWYIAKGSRSEGLHGEIEGIEVNEKRKGMQIDSSIGPLTYCGEWNQREHLFSRSGWLPADLEGIYPSWRHIQSE
jgi:hypothetical protein